MKIKYKTNIKPAVAHAVGTPNAVGTPKREHTKNRRLAQGSKKIKSKSNI
jgi:hypothetical protein